MSIYLNKEIIEKKTTIAEALVLLCIVNKVDIEDTLKILKEKDLISSIKMNDKVSYFLNSTGESVITDVVIESNPVIKDFPIEERVELLTPKLQELFPEGKKIGTNYYWRGNKPDIKRKLKSFFIKYAKYTDDQILKATKKYVESFNGDYRYMRLLQYFLWKEVIKDSTKELTSELATYIENDGQDENNNNWKETII